MENKKRVQRKKIEKEIKRSRYILDNCLVVDSDRTFIEKHIKYLENELGYIN